MLVEGTQKRRQKIAPKGRGRPKAFERIDSSHGNIDKFIVPATQGPASGIPDSQKAATANPETQEALLATQETPEPIDVDADIE